MKLYVECGDFELSIMPKGRGSEINITTRGGNVPDVFVDGEQYVEKKQTEEEASSNEAST